MRMFRKKIVRSHETAGMKRSLGATVGNPGHGGSSMNKGIDSAADLPRMTEARTARRDGAQDLRKILSVNTPRMTHAMQQASR